MGMSCPVCRHADREKIELDLAAGKSTGECVKKYKGHKMTYSRHRSKCMGLQENVKRGAPRRDEVKEEVVETEAEWPKRLPYPKEPGLLDAPPPEVPPPPADATAREKLTWLWGATISGLKSVTKSHAYGVLPKMLQRLEAQVQLWEKADSAFAERVEVSGPGGGPVQLQCLPPVVDALRLKAVEGDAFSERAYERYVATGKTELGDQLAELRRLLAEGERDQMTITVVPQ